VEGVFRIRKLTKQEAIQLLRNCEATEVYTNHETIKVLGLTPCTGRPVFNPTGREVQLWVKPRARLEFGREYALDEIERIGYDIWIAEPLAPRSENSAG